MFTNLIGMVIAVKCTSEKRVGILVSILILRSRYVSKKI